MIKRTAKLAVNVSNLCLLLAHVLFASFEFDLTTASGILLGHTTSLPHKNGRITSSVFPTEFFQKTCQLFFRAICFVLSVKDKSPEYHF